MQIRVISTNTTSVKHPHPQWILKDDAISVLINEKINKKARMSSAR
jgi:hypothetical protein